MFKVCALLLVGGISLLTWSTNNMAGLSFDITQGVKPEDLTPKYKPGGDGQDPIFTAYKKAALAKIDKSIKEAKGRYEGADNGPRQDPTPSQNWRVKKKLPHKIVNGLAVADGDEDVMMFVKVGITKIEINPNGETEKQREEVGVKGRILVERLEAVRNWIDSLEKADGGDGDAFWELAIDEARPKTFPLTLEAINAGLNTWAYDGNADQYFPVKGDFEDRKNRAGEVIKTVAQLEKDYKAAVEKKMAQIEAKRKKK